MKKGEGTATEGSLQLLQTTAQLAPISMLPQLQIFKSRPLPDCKEALGSRPAFADPPQQKSSKPGR